MMPGTALAHEDADGLPHSAESERAVLGTIILNNIVAKDAIERLSRHDFYFPSHRSIFDALVTLEKRGSEINAVLIAEELKKDHALESSGGLSYITNLTYGLPGTTNISHYATHLRDAAVRRRGMKIAAALIEKAKDPSTAWAQSVEWLRREVVELEPVKGSSLVQLWREVSALDLPSGDEIIHELERAELGLINSVTNAGKSTLLRNLALSLASGRTFPNIAPFRKIRRVVLLDFETRKRRLQRDSKKMLQTFSKEEQTLVDENFAVVCDAMINDEPLNLSNEDHLRQITADVRAFRAELVILDTLSAAFAVKDENSNSEVTSKILKPLVRMARETQAAILVAHHVGKSSSEDGRTREQAYRGRGASAFGTFPSLVLDLVQDTSDKARVTLSLAKSKGKKFDDVNLQLDKETRWFVVTGQPVVAARTSYDLVLAVFEDGKRLERHEVERLLVDAVAKSTITKHLKTAVDRGQLEKSRRGVYQRPADMLLVPRSI